MARQQGWFALVLAISISATALLFTNPLQLGLDLRGGSLLTVEVKPSSIITKVSSEDVEAVKAVLERRINGLGVAESTLQTIGDSKLVIQLPGEQDPTKAARVLGSTALLEFRIQKEGTEKDLQLLRRIRSDLKAIVNRRKDQKNNGKPQLSLDNAELKLAKELFNLDDGFGSDTRELEKLLEEVNDLIRESFDQTALTGKQLVSAGRKPLQTSKKLWEVTLSFNNKGAEIFAQLTKEIAGSERLLGIFLDGQSISEAIVGNQFKTAGITGGAASITGNFSADAARELEVQLRGGSLPLPVEIIEVRTIGPTLGAENIRRSLLSALSGLMLVAIFMFIEYRLPGSVAVIALSLYGIFNLAIYTLIPVTLTLPGIAGFILSIGMAVDANILIFERIKDEMRRNNTLIRSIDTGFSEAFSSIIDGHITTLISCAALFFLGIGMLKGFAATLGIGVLLSLFTSLTCTRTLMRFLMGYSSLRNPRNFLAIQHIKTLEENQLDLKFTKKK